MSTGRRRDLSAIGVVIGGDGEERSPQCRPWGFRIRSLAELADDALEATRVVGQGDVFYHCHILEHEDAGMMRNFLVG